MHPHVRSTHRKYVHTCSYTQTCKRTYTNTPHAMFMLAYTMHARMKTYTHTRTTYSECARIYSYTRAYTRSHKHARRTHRSSVRVCSNTHACTHACTHTIVRTQGMPQAMLMFTQIPAHMYTYTHTHMDAASSVFGARYGRYGSYGVLRSEETPLR